MPRLTTMNGHYQSVTSAPLDLRTTIRDSVSSRSRTPDCVGTVSGTHVPAGTDRSTEIVLRHAGLEYSPDGSASSSVQLLSPTPANTSNSLTPDKKHCAVVRRTDRSSSSLPLRKRPFPAVPSPETSIQSSVLPGRGGRLFPPENTDITQRNATKGVLKVFEGEKRICEAPVPVGYGRAGSGQFRDAYQMGHSVNSYDHHHPVYPHGLPSVLVNHRSTSLPPSHQAEPPLAFNVAMVMRQDEDGDTPLHIAVVQGEETVVHRLIDIMVTIRDLDIYNNLRQTPLHLAVITQQAGIVETLLRAGADPVVMDRNGQTALHLCCEYGQPGCLSVVLSYLSSSTCLDLKNFEGWSPLHLAVQGGHKLLVRMLLDAGANINAMDIKSGQSPLMHAVESNNVDMVHFLLESGSDVNGQSYSGNTALHSACGRGQVDTVWLLLKKGADCSIKNFHNDTPVMVARNKKIADVLRGKSSKLTRSQDQPIPQSSSRSSNLTASGSSSPNQSP